MIDEEKILDPTFEWDSKLTPTEWTMFWRKRYEDSVTRIHEAAQIIKQQTSAIKRLKVELHAQKLLLDKMPMNLLGKASDQIKTEHGVNGEG